MRLLPMWVVGIVVVGILMWGGVFGLQYVENTNWGGLPLTLILATVGIAFAFPFGLILALVRRRSEEHTSVIQSLMRISYADFCLKNKINIQKVIITCNK